MSADDSCCEARTVWTVSGVYMILKMYGVPRRGERQAPVDRRTGRDLAGPVIFARLGEGPAQRLARVARHARVQPDDAVDGRRQPDHALRLAIPDREPERPEVGLADREDAKGVASLRPRPLVTRLPRQL